MTIEEAIKNNRKLEMVAIARAKGMNNKKAIKTQTELAEYYSQIAEWLEELKVRRAIHTQAEKEIRIDERAKVLDEIIDIVAIACNFDEDNKAEMKQYILEKLKEQE